MQAIELQLSTVSTCKGARGFKGRRALATGRTLLSARARLISLVSCLLPVLFFFLAPSIQGSLVRLRGSLQREPAARYRCHGTLVEGNGSRPDVVLGCKWLTQAGAVDFWLSMMTP